MSEVVPVVKPEDERPTGKGSGVCFYCKSPIRDSHKRDCVLFKKKVRVAAIIEYDIEVPDFWEADDILFQRNEGSWCSDNMLDELEELKKSGVDFCDITRFVIPEVKDTKKITTSQKGTK